MYPWLGQVVSGLAIVLSVCTLLAIILSKVSLVPKILRRPDHELPLPGLAGVHDGQGGEMCPAVAEPGQLNQSSSFWQAELRRHGRAELERFWKEIVALHRHEDTLINSRFQGFMVVTSILVAAFAQFRDDQYWILRVVVSLFGLAIGIIMWWVLWRTAHAIEWYRGVLGDLDPLVFGEWLYPYELRHRLANQAVGGAVRRPVTDALARLTPMGIVALWIVFLAISGLGAKPPGRVTGSRVSDSQQLLREHCGEVSDQTVGGRNTPRVHSAAPRPPASCRCISAPGNDVPALSNYSFATESFPPADSLVLPKPQTHAETGAARSGR